MSTEEVDAFLGLLNAIKGELPAARDLAIQVEKHTDGQKPMVVLLMHLIAANALAQKMGLSRATVVEFFNLLDNLMKLGQEQTGN